MTTKEVAHLRQTQFTLGETSRRIVVRIYEFHLLNNKEAMTERTT